MKNILAIITSLFLFPMVVVAGEGSVNCEKISSQSDFVSKSVCSDPELKKLDPIVMKNFASLYKAYDEAGYDYGKFIEKDLMDWADTLEKCKTVECLREKFIARANEYCNAALPANVHMKNCIKYDVPKIKDDSSNNEAPVQQLSEMPFEVQVSGNSIFVMPRQDGVVINAIEVNRGHCKTVDLVLARKQIKEQRVSIINNGTLTYGAQQKYMTDYNCNVIETTFNTNVGSWTVTFR